MNHCAYCENEDSCKNSTTHQWCSAYTQRRTMEPQRLEEKPKPAVPIGAITIPSHHFIPEVDMTDRLKYDSGKTMWHLMPLDVLEGIAKIMTFGAVKYEENGWKSPDLKIERVYSAMMRHYKAMMDGEHLDPESGMPHAYHFATNAIFIAYKNVEGEADEDR